MNGFIFYVLGKVGPLDAMGGKQMHHLTFFFNQPWIKGFSNKLLKEFLRNSINLFFECKKGHFNTG